MTSKVSWILPWVSQCLSKHANSWNVTQWYLWWPSCLLFPSYWGCSTSFRVAMAWRAACSLRHEEKIQLVTRRPTVGQRSDKLDKVRELGCRVVAAVVLEFIVLSHPRTSKTLTPHWSYGIEVIEQHFHKNDSLDSLDALSRLSHLSRLPIFQWHPRTKTTSNKRFTPSVVFLQKPIWRVSRRHVYSTQALAATSE